MLLEAIWKTLDLTPAEQSVATLLIAGESIELIAQSRGAAPGTVRTQLGRVYLKAGVSDRKEFAAAVLFRVLEAH